MSFIMLRRLVTKYRPALTICHRRDFTTSLPTLTETNSGHTTNSTLDTLRTITLIPGK